MEPLQCVPPFQAVPTEVEFSDKHIAIDEECQLGRGTINNASPHHVAFAGVISHDERVGQPQSVVAVRVGARVAQSIS